VPGDRHAAPAVELMDVLMAARMLKSMDPPAAARLLETMDPAAAAVRITGPNLTRLLTLMDAPAARAVLQTMSPEAAGERLEWLRPFEAAAALLQPMDPDFIIDVLAAMPRWGPQSVLLAMPPDIAEPLLARLRQDPVAGKRWNLDFNPPR
jgi:Mg/Co/Ni transporter MgtE